MIERVRYLNDGRVPVVEGHAASSLSPEDVESAERLLETHGQVLFRGFEITAQHFMAWTKLWGATHGTRKLAPGSTDTAGGPIGLHIEAAMTQCVPSWIWFYGLKPAPRGGDTLLCDGALIAESLSPDARRFLEHNEVLYWWRRSAPFRTPPASPLVDPPGMTRGYREMSETACGPPYEFASICRPLIRSRVGGRIVFGNAMLNTLLHEDGGDAPPVDGFHCVRLATKARVPHDLIEELTAVASRHTVAVRLERNDVLCVDNTRVMHGREAFTGPRQILVCHTYHRDQVRHLAAS